MAQVKRKLPSKAKPSMVNYGLGHSFFMAKSLIRFFCVSGQEKFRPENSIFLSQPAKMAQIARKLQSESKPRMQTAIWYILFLRQRAKHNFSLSVARKHVFSNRREIRAFWPLKRKKKDMTYATEKLHYRRFCHRQFATKVNHQKMLTHKNCIQSKIQKHFFGYTILI